MADERPLFSSPAAHAEALLALAERSCIAGRFDDAICALREGISVAPTMPELHNNLGTLLLARGRFADAEAALTTALRLWPTSPQPPLNLGNLCASLGRRVEALQWYQRAAQADPSNVDAIGNQGLVYEELGLVDQAVEIFRHALSIAPNHAATLDNMLLAVTRSGRFTPAEVFAAHREYHSRIVAPPAAAHPPTARFDNDPDPDRPVRIGYLSYDLRQHPVALFLEPLLEARNRAAFHVTAYSTFPEPDEVSRRIRGLVDEWHDVGHLFDDALARQIREDHIDILIDLSGHTVGNRLIALAMKPAPVQMTYLGYPNTTGMEAIDYRITDAVADPVGMTESLHSETLLRLTPCAWCYRPPSDCPPVAGLPALRNGYVTFGSFNILAKVSDATVQLWSRVLSAVPPSRLLIKAKALADAEARRITLERFARHGIDTSRIELDPGGGSIVDHLAAYSRVDLALDPFPYHGTTSTCEAMLMGVPVLTLAGVTHASRVGASLLSAVGIAQFVASDVDHLVRIATDWSNDLLQLTQMRASLRDRLLRSPLCDAASFARGFESALREAWTRWCHR